MMKNLIYFILSDEGHIEMSYAVNGVSKLLSYH